MYIPTHSILITIIASLSFISALPSKVKVTNVNLQSRDRDTDKRDGGGRHHGNGHWPSASASGRPRGNQKRIILVPTLPLGSRDDLARCPSTMIACPLTQMVDMTSTTTADEVYECISYLEDLYSCGGCSTIGTGQDCTAITGVKSASCSAGACWVHSCKQGFRPSKDGHSCEALSPNLIEQTDEWF